MKKLLSAILLVLLISPVFSSCQLATMADAGTSPGTTPSATLPPLVTLSPSPILTPSPSPSPSPTAAVTPTAAPTASPTPKVTTPAPAAENNSATVYITDTGEKYHRSGCRSLSKSKTAISLSDAKARGYTPCDICKP